MLLKQRIRDKYYTLTDVYIVVDGLKLMLEQSGDMAIQDMFYNGCTHDRYAGNTFVFAPNQFVINCVINAHGNMHDSYITE